MMMAAVAMPFRSVNEEIAIESEVNSEDTATPAPTIRRTIEAVSWAAPTPLPWRLLAISISSSGPVVTSIDAVNTASALPSR